MGQKTHPVGFRLGIVRAWDANWYDDKSFSNKLQEDALVRNYVRNRLKKAGIARVQIDRTPKRAVVTIHTSRPRYCDWEKRKRNCSARRRVERRLHQKKLRFLFMK